MSYYYVYKHSSFLSYITNFDIIVFQVTELELTFMDPRIHAPFGGD